jgi:hypothetical protein
MNDYKDTTMLENHGIKSLLYPILVNIFLERLDIYIEKIASIDMTNNRVLNHDFLGMSSVKLSYVRYEDQ